MAFLSGQIFDYLQIFIIAAVNIAILMITAPRGKRLKVALVFGGIIAAFATYIYANDYFKPDWVYIWQFTKNILKYAWIFIKGFIGLFLMWLTIWVVRDIESKEDMTPQHRVMETIICVTFMGILIIWFTEPAVKAIMLAVAGG